jgi:hypothetical protein
MLEFLIDNIFVSFGGLIENVINIPVCEIKGPSLMNLLIFYKLLKKLGLI